MEDLDRCDSIGAVCSRLIALSQNENIVNELKYCLSCWDYKSILTVNGFEEDINQITKEIIDLKLPNLNIDDIFNLIKTFIHYEIYDTIFFRLKESFSNEDLSILKSSKEFCKSNGTPKLLGSTFYNFIPNAAVVELSMLSNKRTPVEKLTCLQSAYDNIFAEVKGALISVISKYSEKEIDVPSINNKEVLPIVMSVILKSKLFYFKSELSYAKLFGAEIFEGYPHFRETIKVFEESLKQIFNLNSYYEMSTDKLEQQMSVCDTINFVENLHNDVPSNQSLFTEERKRVVKLITSATTEDLEN